MLPSKGYILGSVSFRRAAWVCAFFGFLVFATGLAMELYAPFKGAKDWKHPPLVRPGLALQLPVSMAEVEAMVAGVETVAIRRLEWDYFFILSYAFFFASLAVVHFRQKAPHWKPLAVFTLFFTATTVVLDVMENLHLADVVLGGAAPDLVISGLKWFSFFTVMLLSAPIYVRRVRWPFVIGAALVFFATLGMIGCVGLLVTTASRAVIAVALDLTLITTLVGLGVLFRPLPLLPPTAIAD